MGRPCTDAFPATTGLCTLLHLDNMLCFSYCIGGCAVRNNIILGINTVVCKETINDTYDYNQWTYKKVDAQKVQLFMRGNGLRVNPADTGKEASLVVDGGPPTTWTYQMQSNSDGNCLVTLQSLEGRYLRHTTPAENPSWKVFNAPPIYSVDIATTDPPSSDAYKFIIVTLQ